MTEPRNKTQREDQPFVLVAEGSEPLREYLRVVLVLGGCRVFIARDGVEALEFARGLAHLDALVSDIEMPRMLGDELAVRFHTLHPEAAIVFISSSAPTGVDAAFEFLPKPFTMQALFSTLNHALASRAHAA